MKHVQNILVDIMDRQSQCMPSQQAEVYKLIVKSVFKWSNVLFRSIKSGTQLARAPAAALMQFPGNAITSEILKGVYPFPPW